MTNRILKTFCAAWLGLTVVGCDTANNGPATSDEIATTGEKDSFADVQAALSALPRSQVVDTHADGIASFLKGDLGTATPGAQGIAAHAGMAAALQQIAPAFRLNAQDLVFQRATVDAQGNEHIRYAQTKNGLRVVGGDLVAHVNASGKVFMVNGTARDGQKVSVQPRISAEAAALAARNAEAATGTAASGTQLVYVRTDSGALKLAYESLVTGTRADGLPVRTLTYVDAQDGSLLLKNPLVREALNRKVYSSNNTTTTPGTLKRSEGGAAVGDTHVDTNYLKLGGTYDCYKNNFGRDSINNAGATLISSVHYSTNYVNAYWDGTQMVYGDGNGVDSGMLGLSADVTTHELTHAVTENESNLTYSGESGGINEAMSDIFGAYCESYASGTWATTNEVFMVGDDIWTPATPGDALRYMYDPAKDGASLDYWTSTAGSKDVHYSSGIANLAFTLLSKGGTHPRGKSTVNVAGIGTQKAGAIFYKANVDILTASSNYAALKNAAVSAAQQLGYDAATVQSVTDAFAAVGVGSSGGGGGGTVTALTNGVAVTGISDSTGADKFYSLAVPAGQASVKFSTTGSSGDMDLYVKLGSQPTTSTYDCASTSASTTESCTINSPAAGTYYVTLHAYSSYTGVSLTGTYTAGSTGSALTNGVATAAYSGASGSMTCWTLSVPSGKTSVVFNQAGVSGNTGDADLYVRFGSAPTTSTYNCRPYLTGNTETCTISNPSAGTWYACSRGYSAYTGVTMKGTY